MIASLLIANRGEIACRITRAARRREVPAGLTPAPAIIIAGIYDPAWLPEIEVIAARSGRDEGR